MRRKALWAVAALATLMLAGCRKSCTCMAFNGTSHTYTADEVEANGGSCTGMVYMYTTGSSGADVRYYTVCNWD